MHHIINVTTQKQQLPRKNQVYTLCHTWVEIFNGKYNKLKLPVFVGMKKLYVGSNPAKDFNIFAMSEGIFIRAIFPLTPVFRTGKMRPGSED